MRAVVFLDTDFISLGKQDADGIHECTGRIPPKTGAMAIIRRPFCNTGWKAKFGLVITDDRISPSMVEQSLEEAGLVKGLYAHRPEYGRFKINKFEVQKE